MDSRIDAAPLSDVREADAPASAGGSSVLEHSGVFEHDAFISYRRSDGTRAARWLRHALLRYRLPKALQRRSTPVTVYLDTIYERATDDFFERNIKPALERSRYLLVIATRDALTPRTDGTANWVEREIEAFSRTPQRRNVLIATTGDVDAPLPGSLRDVFPNGEVVSLRDCSLLRFVIWPRWWRLRDELLKIVAPLHDVDTADMPLLRQEERNRRLTLAWSVSIASLVLLATMTGLAAWAYTEYRSAEASRVAEHEAQIGTLLKANPRAVPDILESLRPAQDDVLERLRRAWTRPAPLLTDVERGRSALALLALSPADRDNVKRGLYDRMLRASALEELLLLRNGLRPYGRELRDETWKTATDPTVSADARFRALIVLAGFDSGSERWPVLAEQVAGRLVEANPLEIAVLVEVFTPIRSPLIEPLTKIFKGESHAERRGVAASILARYAADDTETLIDLVTHADAEQFGRLVPLLEEERHRGKAIALLSARLAAVAASSPSLVERDADAAARRAARAAVAAWQLGRVDLAAPFLANRPDPSVRAYLVHTLGLFGTRVETVIQRLKVATNPSERRALILSLGQFSAGELTADRRAVLLPTLLEWYQHDPDAGIHSAIDWLLRHDRQGETPRRVDWQQGQVLSRLDRDFTVGWHSDRNWFVGRAGQLMTVIRGPVTFRMSSRADVEDTTLVRTRIPRTFAIGAKEVTVAEFMRFVRAKSLRDDWDYLKRFSPDPDSPMVGVTWFLAAQYINWLNDLEGLPKCYVMRLDGAVNLAKDFMDQPCYRLPTEAEWEYAARAGSVTTRFFGSSEDLLEEYAWYGKNSRDRAWPVGQLKPNDLGLFDVYGNAVEWLQERDGRRDRGQLTGDAAVRRRQQELDDIPDSLMFVDDESGRVLRGGSFTDRMVVARSGERNVRPPGDRTVQYGFRLARTLPAPGAIAPGKPDPESKP